jgi:hypothetical protein
LFLFFLLISIFNNKGIDAFHGGNFLFVFSRKIHYLCRKQRTEAMKKLLTFALVVIAITGMAVTTPNKPQKDASKSDTVKVDTIPLDSITIVDEYSPAPQM